jgi:hypothetical protein
LQELEKITSFSSGEILLVIIDFLQTLYKFSEVGTLLLMVGQKVFLVIKVQL